MSIAALFTWMATVLGGLALLIIWLMEYDRDTQSTAATRLPVSVISLHALLGTGGLLVWGLYLVGDEERLGWITVADLAIVVALGLTMATRWIGVYRAYAAPDSSPTMFVTVPPERYFPRPVVLLHGVLAVTTVVLVVLTVFFDGS
jgi:manganese efflux pump family protein